MATPLPPDPYNILGIPKDAEFSAIKSAYRKLVLQCHPDKVQDAELKAVKQDEFQKVQQAYELLSDDVRRAQYDEQVKLFAFRKEMNRNGPSPGKNVFEYEIKTAEPRSAYRPKTRVYAQQSPRSYEDDLGPRTFEEPLKARARKTASYEERRRPSTREDEKRRRAEEERQRERWERDAKRATHGASKKSRDKERKRGFEEKHSRTTEPYMEDDDSEDAYRPKVERKPNRRMEKEPYRVAEKVRVDDQMVTDRTRKLYAHEGFAETYMEAMRRKADPEADYRPKPRIDTPQEQQYTIRYAAPFPDDDSPRRSSARRPPEQVPIPIRSREPPMSSRKDRKGSTGYEREPLIVEANPPSPTVPSIKKPTLHSHSSAPPIIPHVSSSRREPHRSKTTLPEFSRREVPAPPPLSRAATFQSGDRGVKSAPKGSRLRRPVDASESDSDPPVYSSPRPVSPIPRRREPEPVSARYVSQAFPHREHRSELREDSYGYHRDRSESPRGSRRSTERPPVIRSSGSGSGSGSSPHQPFSRGVYPANLSPEPIIKEARPKNLPQTSARATSTRSNYFSEVKYAPSYGLNDVSYAKTFRRGSEPTHQAYEYVVPRPKRETAYA